MKLIQIAAKENKVKLADDQLEQLSDGDIKPEDPNEKRATNLDIFHPSLRTRSLIIFFDWFVNSMTYYGLLWNTSDLGGNIYINFIVSGALEISAYLFLLRTLNRFGCKVILCGCMVTAGVALLLTMIVPDSQFWLVVTLTVLGKLAITFSYGTIYIFSTEQFPTAIRNAGLGAGATSARVGSIFAPLINYLASKVWMRFPLIIFGILALIGGCLSLVLPETLNQQLPETIADREQFGKAKDGAIEESQHLKTVTTDINTKSPEEQQLTSNGPENNTNNEKS